jgi:polysaccharide biosynthesis protein PslH
MRVVHLTPELPYWPGGSGGATRQFHLLRRLAELGHEPTVVAPVARAEEGKRRLLREAGIELYSFERPASRIVESLRALARSPRLVARAVTLPVLAWQVSVFWTTLRERALAAVREQRPDVVSVEHDSAAGWAADLPPGLPAVLIFQNVSWHYYRNRATAAHGLAQLGLSLEARRFQRHDLRHLGRYSTLVAVSARDADEIRQASETPVEVVPNGVATDALGPLDEAGGPPTLLFTGTLNHPPNAEGIRWFAERVWPLVRERKADAQLLVVGRSPPPAVRRLARIDGIEVHGPVGEMRPWFERATAVVAPLLSGGGTRLKILEAMAAQRAVVSTSVGMEGLELQGGRELLVEDRPPAFADAVLRVLDDAALRRRLAEAGRSATVKSHDWRTLGDRFAAVLERAAA